MRWRSTFSCMHSERAGYQKEILSIAIFCPNLLSKQKCPWELIKANKDSQYLFWYRKRLLGQIATNRFTMHQTWHKSSWITQNIWGRAYVQFTRALIISAGILNNPMQIYCCLQLWKSAHTSSYLHLLPCSWIRYWFCAIVFCSLQPDYKKLMRLAVKLDYIHPL